ncbi:MAG TPA: hypothetical protein GX011_02370 [Clostridiales bacterium]|jgi:hypothetical protein|nr:hypothetical protein [Clostridiales bacterium]
MEQIYTIPVNEAFDVSAADPALGCPLCALYNKLEDHELELILGASMMEPDVRIKTNEEGFCRTHYDMMFTRKNRLGMALTLQSHLDELRKRTSTGATFGDPAAGAVQRISSLVGSCYICRKVEYHFGRMVETVVFLWESDENFPGKLESQPYFCLPHYRLLLLQAKRRLPKKKYPGFVHALAGVVEPYFDKLRDDIDWFCKKFDYRYDSEPWYDSRDAVERAIKFLRADLHVGPEKGKKPQNAKDAQEGRANEPE